MKPGQYFILVLKSLTTFVVLLVLLVSVLDFLNLTFTIDGARQILVKNIKSYTGRNVRIDGDVELTISLFPQLIAKQIHITNPDNFDNEDFMTVNEARVAASLLPLLSGEFLFTEISADQVKINLTEKKDGSDNWTFDNTAQSSKPVKAPLADSRTGTSGMRRLSINTFQLSNVAIKYTDESRDQVIDTQLDTLIIKLEDTAKPVAEINGNIQGYPYELTFESDALTTLTTGKPWLLHGSGQIAGKRTQVKASIKLIENAITGIADINVAKVNLGRLLDALGIISGENAATDSINIKVKVRGTDPIELYEQAEINLLLGKGYWDLQTTTESEKKVLLFNSASAFTSWNKPVVINIDGTLVEEAIKLEFKSNRLFEFFDEVQKMDIDLVSNIAGIDIRLNGTLDLPVNEQQFNLDISLKGRDLEKLNPILDTEFPPFNDFDVSGNLIANSKGYVLKSAKASIGETQMQASVVIETNLAKPLWTVNLKSHQIQLKDFAFDDWSIKQTETYTERTTKQMINDKAYLEPLRRLEEIVHEPEMHLNLNMNVDKLLSGEDLLGKAQFQLHLRDDEFSIKNADIELPGGRIKSSVSVNKDDNAASGHLVLDIDKLDYGITTRLFKSDSQVDGVISTRIDLQLEGRDFTRLLDNATGQFDIALWPKNTRPAKALNLWATNLYLILLPELKKKESKVNCIVGLMDIANGNMDEQLFAIDTTKLWINGNIDVDFKKERVQLSLFPRSKTARLFSLQSPIRAQGSFSELSMLINPIDLAGTYVSFVTSPLHVPTRWIFGDKPSENGSAVCEQLFDREYVIKLKAEADLKQKQEIDKMLDED